MRMTRREVLTASVTAATLGSVAIASRRDSSARLKFPVTQVSVQKAPAYSMAIYDQIYRLLVDHRLNVKGKRIVLKPNLVEFDSNTCINTHPMVVHATFEAFKKLGAAEIHIAEGPGHRRGTLDLAESAGYFDTFTDFEDAFTDLNTDIVAKRDIPSPVSKLRSLYLPQTILNCDLLVSLPKMKTHHWAGATLSMKNLFGVVPGGVYGWPKNVLHWAGIPQSIVDLHHLFPRQFAIVDGIIGMEGNGPIQGTPKASGVLVAGSDVAAVDATCCRIMGINPERIEYLQIARGEANLKESSFTQIGERIDSVRNPFELLDVWKEVRG